MLDIVEAKKAKTLAKASKTYECLEKDIMTLAKPGYTGHEIPASSRVGPLPSRQDGISFTWTISHLADKRNVTL